MGSGLTLRPSTASVLLAVSIAAAELAAAQAPPPGAPHRLTALAGIVRDTLERPIDWVTVLLDGTDLSTVSDDSGRFHLGGITPGSRTFTVMRIGYEPLSFETTLAPDTTLTVDIQLRPTKMLEPVDVTAVRASRFTRTGFYDRQRLGTGAFVSPERVDSLRYVTSPARLLRDVPGIDVRCGPAGACVVRPRWTNCLLLIVDGVSYGESQLDNVLGTSEVHAIEVYDRASRVPIEFQGRLPRRTGGLTVRAGCGAIAVWTKSRAP